MKQVFHSIPWGSSYSISHRRVVEKKMRKKYLIMALIGMMVGSLGIAVAGADEVLMNKYVKPGDSIDLPFSGAPGSSLTVTVAGSRGLLSNVTLEFDETGKHIWRYTVNETAYTDNIRVTAVIDGETKVAEFVVSRMTPSQLAQTMRTMAENAKKQAESALIEARKAGNQNETTLELFRDAVRLLRDSRNFAEQGEHASAFETIKEAMTMFKTVIYEAYNTDVAPPEHAENDRKLVRAKGALLDLTRRLEELKQTSQSLEKNGFNVEKLNEHIFRLEEGLGKAREAIEANNIGAAERHLNAIDETLNNIMNNLRQRMQEHNKRKASLYQTALVNRYITMRNTLTFMRSVDSDRVTNVLAELDRIEDNLDEARRLHDEGKITESVRVLYLADKDFKQTFYGINGDDTRTLLNSLDRLTAQLETDMSLRERLKLQNQIEEAKESLRTKLEQNALTSTHQPSDSMDQNATDLTP
jgi:hypothetical protein